MKFERLTVPDLPFPDLVAFNNRVHEWIDPWFAPRWARRSAYDWFMLRFHDFLKRNADFQERGVKRRWTFPPGSAWLAMTDACCHADLRGRFALEHSYFIAPEALALPDESPAALLPFAGTLGRAA